jgi:hypothetical protein
MHDGILKHIFAIYYTVYGMYYLICKTVLFLVNGLRFACSVMILGINELLHNKIYQFYFAVFDDDTVGENIVAFLLII